MHSLASPAVFPQRGVTRLGSHPACCWLPKGQACLPPIPLESSKCRLSPLGSDPPRSATTALHPSLLRACNNQPARPVRFRNSHSTPASRRATAAFTQPPRFHHPSIQLVSDPLLRAAQSTRRRKLTVVGQSETGTHLPSPTRMHTTSNASNPTFAPFTAPISYHQSDFPASFARGRIRSPLPSLET